jgi:hypothetical protein
MNILCKMLGHKRNAGWWGDGLYGVLSAPTTDGTGRTHHTVTLVCDRCSEDYIAARFHGPIPTPPTVSENTKVMAYALEGFANLDRLITKKEGPHRIKWEGEWHEGPGADAFIALVEAIARASRTAMAMVQARVKETDRRADESDADYICRLLAIARDK